MVKKPSAIYEPGELARVRGKLGSIDEAEAKRMTQILGGEVGEEKSATFKAPVKKSAPIRRENVELMIPGRRGKRPGRGLDIPGDNIKVTLPGFGDPGDDPSIQLNTSYGERVKMDRYAAQFEFEIKTSLQAFISALSFFGEPADNVNPRFVNRRMNIYYRKIEQLVSSTRTLLPRNNARRSERLKKSSPFIYSILDTIRYWNIARIDSDLAKIQAHPRSAKVSEFADILRAVYKPLFILEKLDQEIHIKSAYRLLYKLIILENPAESKEKNQELIRSALSSFSEIRRDVRFGLYPLLMKHISDRWFPFERIFIDRRHRLMSFLAVTEDDQIIPVDLSAEKAENLEALREEIQKEQEDGQAEGKSQDGEAEAPGDLQAAARQEVAAMEEAEKKALERSLGVLETLFPKAGWDKLTEYPDLYPYFADLYGLRRGYELLAPTDPLQQIAIFMFILEDLCVAMRYVSFGTATNADGSHEQVNEMIGSIVTNWRGYLDDSFTKEYLPRLNDYCRMLEQSAESKISVYAKRTLNELRWMKRLYFLPYFKFESIGPPPFQKKDIKSIYSEVRKLRRGFTLVAAGIEQGKNEGGPAAKAVCQGIGNPWEKYNFEVPNPVSKRLDVILGPGKRNNAAIVFFALSVSTILDHLLNNESSWAYADQPGYFFRSVNGQGVVPMFGVEKKLDADQIFKDVMKQKLAERQKLQAKS